MKQLLAGRSPRRLRVAIFGAMAAVVVAGLGFVGGLGFAVGDRWWGADAVAIPPQQRESFRQTALDHVFGERTLHAAAAVQAESFAMATGPIDSDVEGLYILDSVSGDLQCVVLNFRTGKFNAVFRANVIQDLGLEAAAKRPTYLLTTGSINFPRGASVARPGNSVVYVLDTTSGVFAAYGIPWRRELAATGRPQSAGLTLLDIGRARTAALRE